MKTYQSFKTLLLVLSLLLCYKISQSQPVSTVEANHVSDFISGYAVGVYNGIYFILDKDGKQHAIGIYDFVSTFYKGYAVVRKNGRVGIIHMNSSQPTITLQPDYLAITLPDPDGICVLTDASNNHFTIDLNSPNIEPKDIKDKRILRLSTQEDCIKSNYWDYTATVVIDENDLSDFQLEDLGIMQLVHPLYYFDYFDINDNQVESREHGIPATHKPTYTLDSTKIFKIYNEKMDAKEVSPTSIKIIEINYLNKTTAGCMFAKITALDLFQSKKKYFITTCSNASSFQTITTHQPSTGENSDEITYEWIQEIRNSDTVSYFRAITGAMDTFEVYPAYCTMAGNRLENSFFILSAIGPYYTNTAFTQLHQSGFSEQNITECLKKYKPRIYNVLGKFDPDSNLAYVEYEDKKTGKKITGFINKKEDLILEITTEN